MIDPGIKSVLKALDLDFAEAVVRLAFAAHVNRKRAQSGMTCLLSTRLVSSSQAVTHMLPWMVS